MNKDLALLVSMGNVLEAAKKGKGVSQALVAEFKASAGPGKAVARRALLGFPVGVALNPLEDSDSEEVSMLATLIVSSHQGSARLVGDRGRSLAATLERWLRSKESSRLESRVMRWRALIASAVLGAVSAMVATLGPLVSGLSLSPVPAQATSPYLLVVAALMVAASSSMLGIFMSGKGFLPNLIASVVVFSLVSFWVAPLASVGSYTLWGIK
jgi:uncharacterized membrane protein YvlD (DUF360 family)